MWQAYALCSYLRRTYTGHTFDLVDYRHSSKYRSIVSLRSEELVAIYESVLAEYLGSRRIESDGTDQLFELIDQTYDAVIVGSDIIWQFGRKHGWLTRMMQSYERRGALHPSRDSLYAYARSVKNWLKQVWWGAHVKDARKIDFPNAYWLAPELKPGKATYAASIGYSDMHRIPEALRAPMKRHIESLDFISVRDKATQGFVQSLDRSLGDRTCLTPDPAWLFDDPLPDVHAIMQQAGIPAGVKLAGVLIPKKGWYGEQLQKWIYPSLRERGYHIVTIIDENPLADTNLARTVLTPFAWWSVIRSLGFFVTVRTHPSIAALMYGTPLFNIDITAMMNRAGHSKSHDMLDVFDLGDCCRYKRSDFQKDIILNGLFRSMDRDWNWDHIARQVQNNRNACRSTIAEMIKALEASSRRH